MIVCLPHVVLVALSARLRYLISRSWQRMFEPSYGGPSPDLTGHVAQELAGATTERAQKRLDAGESARATAI